MFVCVTYVVCVCVCAVLLWLISQTAHYTHMHTNNPHPAHTIHYTHNYRVLGPALVLR